MYTLRGKCIALLISSGTILVCKRKLSPVSVGWVVLKRLIKLKQLGPYKLRKSKALFCLLDFADEICDPDVEVFRSAGDKDRSLCLPNKKENKKEGNCPFGKCADWTNPSISIPTPLFRLGSSEQSIKFHNFRKIIFMTSSLQMDDVIMNCWLTYQCDVTKYEEMQQNCMRRNEFTITRRSGFGS